MTLSIEHYRKIANILGLETIEIYTLKSFPFLHIKLFTSHNYVTININGPLRDNLRFLVALKKLYRIHTNATGSFPYFFIGKDKYTIFETCRFSGQQVWGLKINGQKI